MLKADVKIGGFYVIRHHGGPFRVVKIVGERKNYRPSGSGRHGYTALNLDTGRMIVLKSAAVLRYECTPNGERI